MERRQHILDQLRVEPGTKGNLAGRDTAWTGGPEFAELSAAKLKATAKKLLAQGVEELADAQELLWASDSRALLVVFQAIDAAGKDSTIKHVMSGVNPQGVQVVSFRKPSSEELDHTYLWRISRALPERGRIGIFNRSHYEEVVALRVHPEWLDRQPSPPGPPATSSGQLATTTSTPSSGTSTATAPRSSSSSCTSPRPSSDVASSPGSTVPRRSGSSRPTTSPNAATGTTTWTRSSEAITATSTEWAPWYVLPADHKHVMQAMTAAILIDAIGGLDLQFPTVSDDDRKANAVARKQLEAEPES